MTDEERIYEESLLSELEIQLMLLLMNYWNCLKILIKSIRLSA